MPQQFLHHFSPFAFSQAVKMRLFGDGV